MKDYLARLGIGRGRIRTVSYGEEKPLDIHSAATKRADELLSQSYAHLYRLPQTGFRFFTVYGPWGRPDMAYWLFTDAILKGEPISVFNNGDMQRDFTHVDDIAAGAVAAADRIVRDPENTAPIYNLGNNRPVRLLDFIAAIEKATGRQARMEMKPKPAGDVLIRFDQAPESLPVRQRPCSVRAATAGTA